MKLTFLGTGTSQGIPVIGCECEVCKSSDLKDQRLRTSALLQTDSTTLVFDSGPDFRQQMLRNSVNRLDAVLLTHLHRDHTAGLDDTRSFVFRQKKAMDLYGSAETLESIRKEFSYVFSDNKYPGAPEVNLNVISESAFDVNELSVQPIPVLHGSLEVLGFRIGNMAYITDAKTIPASSMDLLRDLDVLVLNALRKEEHHSHFNLEQAIEISAELKAKSTFFTHLSHHMGRQAEVSKLLPQNIHLACDGLSVNI